MLSTLMFQFNWKPHYINKKLYCDNFDNYGIVFLYKECEKEHEKIPKK